MYRDTHGFAAARFGGIGNALIDACLPLIEHAGRFQNPQIYSMVCMSVLRYVFPRPTLNSIVCPVLHAFGSGGVVAL